MCTVRCSPSHRVHMSAANKRPSNMASSLDRHPAVPTGGGTVTKGLMDANLSQVEWD